MSGTDAHIAKAERLLGSFREIGAEHAELRVVALYYSALHLASAVAAGSGLVFPSHLQLHSWLKAEHPAVWEHYSPLLQASLEARYNVGPLRIGADGLERVLHKTHYRRVRDWSEECT